MTVKLLRVFYVYILEVKLWGKRWAKKIGNRMNKPSLLKSQDSFLDIKPPPLVSGFNADQKLTNVAIPPMTTGG